MKECNIVKQSPLAGLAAYGGGSGSVLFGRKGVDGYTIERSLRFNPSDSAYLNRTPSSSSNRRTFTYSYWVKECGKGSSPFNNPHVLWSGTSVETRGGIVHRGTGSDANKLYVFNQVSNSTNMSVWSNSLHRDFSAWKHIIWAIDTTQSTATNRVKLYVNGVQETLNFVTTPAQNLELQININQTHQIGRGTPDDYGNFYLADIHFIDGSALGPSSFGETNSDGVWDPKEYDGSFGTNGFYLKFDDSSSTTTISQDSSGNGNNWTSNNIGVSAGPNNDSMFDSPTNGSQAESGAGGQVSANYATFNPLDSLQTHSNGNLQVISNGGTLPRAATSTLAVESGKWYAEVEVEAESGGQKSIIGVIEASYSGMIATNGNIPNSNTDSVFVFGESGQKFIDGVSTSYGSGIAPGDVIGIALNLDDDEITFYKNVNSMGTITTKSFNGAYKIAVGRGSSSGSTTYILNAGQRAFANNAPSGFKPWSTASMTRPAIEDGSDYFDVSLWTGDGNTGRNITGLSFSPDFTWIKCRSLSKAHALFDTVRGANKRLQTSTNNAETTHTDQLSAFISDGFTIEDNNTVNDNGATYAGWSWNAGANSNKTYAVKVVSDSGNKYRFDDFGTSAVTLDLAEGSTYIFDQSDSSNSGHPLRFSTTSNGTHGGGTEYTTGVTVTGTPGQAGAKTTIVVAASAPTLYYYCSVHSGMGGQANTNSTSGASNFAGTTQATVKANQTAGFSIVTYTGTGSNATVGHGLNAAPEMIILKGRSFADDWRVYHKELDATEPEDYYMILQSTNTRSADQNASFMNDTAPTSSVFSLGTDSAINGSSRTMLAYCFAPVAGYSAIGSYEGNGNADGPFIHCGFRPAFVFLRDIDTVRDWRIYDNKRPAYNPADKVLVPNGNNVEDTTSHPLDFLSNGFKVRGTLGGVNDNGDTMIYLAIAEHPFKTARAR